LPPPAEAARLFSQSHVQGGGTIKPENVYTAVINNFTYMQLWFGGGALQTFAVYKDGTVKMVDQVEIDLKRYGKPKIDQNKIVVAPTARSAPSTMEAKASHGLAAAKSDTTSASRRLETQRPPGKKSRVVPARKTGARRSTATPSNSSSSATTTPMPPGSQMPMNH
jgi:hypothetical protein